MATTLALKIDSSGMVAGAAQANAALTSIDAGSKLAVGGVRSLQSGITSLQGLLIGGALAMGVRRVVGEFSAFSREMANVAAVSGASEKQLAMLGRQAIQLGEKTKYTAMDAARSQYALASAGLSVADTMGAVAPILDLAAATQGDLGEMTEATLSVMKGFNLAISDTTRIADVMVASTQRTALNAQRLAAGFRDAAPTAGIYNQSLEGTTALLGVLVDQLQSGERAGVALKQIFIDMNEKLKPFGISTRDSNGRFREFADIMEEIEDKGLDTAELMEAFGSRAGPGLAILLNRGSAAVRDLTRNIQANGQAAEVAQRQMDNLAGDTDQLASAWQSLLIRMGQSQNSGLRSTVQGLTDDVKMLSEHVDLLTDSLVLMLKVGAMFYGARWFTGLTSSAAGATAAMGAASRASVAGRAASAATANMDPLLYGTAGLALARGGAGAAAGGSVGSALATGATFILNAATVTIAIAAGAKILWDLLEYVNLHTGGPSVLDPKKPFNPSNDSAWNQMWINIVSMFQEGRRTREAYRQIQDPDFDWSSGSPIPFGSAAWRRQQGLPPDPGGYPDPSRYRTPNADTFRAKAVPSPEEVERAKALEQAYRGEMETMARTLALHGKDTEVERLRYEFQSGIYVGLAPAKRTELMSLAMQIDRKNELKKLEAEHEMQVRQAESLIESIRTPQEKYNDAVAEYDRLIGPNGVRPNQEAYNRLINQAKQSLWETTDEYKNLRREMEEYDRMIASAVSEKERNMSPQERFNAEERRLRTLAETNPGGNFSWSDYEDSVARLRREILGEMPLIESVGISVADNLNQAFDQMFTGFRDGTINMQQWFRQALMNMLADMASSQMRQLFAKIPGLIAGMFSGLSVEQEAAIGTAANSIEDYVRGTGPSPFSAGTGYDSSRITNPYPSPVSKRTITVPVSIDGRVITTVVADDMENGGPTGRAVSKRIG